MLAPDVTVGMSLSGALTPAGLGCSCIIPLIKAGFVDWIVSTGANLYHDMHFALNYPVRVGSFKMDDTELRDNDIVRVYDVLHGLQRLPDGHRTKSCATSSFSPNSKGNGHR